MERLKILIFKIEDRRFALVSGNVKEIIDTSSGVAPVFYGGKALKGLMSFGGDLISVLDSAFVLGTGNDEGDRMVLICKDKGMERAVGVTVSSVKGMEVIPNSRVAPSNESDASYITGFIKEADGNKDGAIALLDLRRFLDYAETRIEKL